MFGVGICPDFVLVLAQLDKGYLQSQELTSLIPYTTSLIKVSCSLSYIHHCC